MGLQFQFQTVKARTSKMKAFTLLLSLAAASAAPESDAKPWLTYANTYGWNGMRAWNGWNGMYNNWYNMPAAYGAYGIWKRDAEADSEAKPWWNTYASAYGWNGMYNGWYNRPYAYGLWKRDAEADSEAKPWWNTYGWNGMYNNWYNMPAAYGAYGIWKGTLRLIPRPSPGGTPMDGTACTT